VGGAAPVVPTAWYALAAALALASALLGGWLMWRRPSGAPAPPPAPELSPPAPAPTPPIAPAPTPVGRIGRYTLLRPLGVGGMAEVFLARAEGEAGFGKLVALKVLQPFFARQPPVVDLFLDEARLAAGLDHPNVVQIHDLGRAGDQYFIAMEYVDGADLAQLLEATRAAGVPVPVPVAVAILRRICDGLHAAHTATGPDGDPLGLVHRDVKSANIYVSRNGAVKVGDFGIAKATHAIRMSRTEIGQIKGTPGYMAPEHRLGQEVDPRADLYGVGAVAYELLSGQPINLDLVALLERGTDGWPHLPPLRRLRTDVPLALDAAVTRALAYQREARFPDCATLEAALAAVAALTGVGSADDKEIGRWARALLDGRASATAPRAEQA
jgi:serine/threonine-protein kinase